MTKFIRRKNDEARRTKPRRLRHSSFGLLSTFEFRHSSFTIMSAPTQELPKQYAHAEPERKWYAFWLERGYFHSEPDPERKRYPKGPYTIVIPPPNVTGALHLGHALNNTLQDVLIRFKRMQGYSALWMPGTDHAGIAPLAVVERRLLNEEKKSRHDL